MTKTCQRCGVAKPLSAFQKAVLSPDGHRHTCRTCPPRGWLRCTRCDTYLHPDHFKRRQKHRNGETGICKWCGGEARRASSRKHLYGITEEQYQLLLEYQGGRCAGCRRNPYGKRLVVDHIHWHCYPDQPHRGCADCVRALACHGCNTSDKLRRRPAVVSSG